MAKKNDKKFDVEKALEKPKSNVEKFLGKTVEQVKKTHSLIRIVEEDGRAFIGTCDFRKERLNLVVNKGKVSEAYYG